MKESARAARDEVAHRRCTAALKELAPDDPKVAEFEEAGLRRMPEPVLAMVEREIMADILEGLASSVTGEPGSSSKSSKSRKKAG